MKRRVGCEIVTENGCPCCKHPERKQLKTVLELPLNAPQGAARMAGVQKYALR